MSDKKRVSSNNFENSCRVCLEQYSPLREIPLDVLKMLDHIVEVKSTDKRLPNKACEDCTKELDSCSKFIEKCKYSYLALLAALEEENGKITYHSDMDDANELESNYEEKNDEIRAEEAKVDMKQESDAEDTKLECAHCKEIFSSKDQWMAHLKTHSFPENKCTICGRNFKYPSTLLKHKRSHRHKPGSEEQIKTSPRKKKSIKNLYVKIKDEGKLKLQCTLCDRVLTTYSAISSHMVTHTGEKPFSCEFCGKKFSSRSSVNIHIRQHTGETPYKCRVCNKGFRSSSSRKKHETVHHFIVKDEDSETDSENKTAKNDINSDVKSDSDKVECEVCKRKIHKHGYGVHRKSHLSEKKQFICNYCNKEFQKNSHLQRHLRIHTGERPYTCEICKKSYVQDGDFKRHMTHYHSGIKQFQCQHCGKFYYTKQGLQSHVVTHLKEQKTVHVTKRPQKTSCREKRFLCMICGKGFTANNSLKVHMMSHTGETPHKCLICGKGYTNTTSLKQHTMRQHTGEKPYGCVICGKQFYDTTNLKKHMNRVHSVIDVVRNDGEEVIVEQK